MSTWRGGQTLALLAARTLGPRHAVAATAVVTTDGARIAVRGASADADFEIGSISKAITGMLYRSAVERDLVAPTTMLGDLLPLAEHGAVARVTLEALATHRSGLPRLAPAMQPLRRTWRLWTRGENPYGDTLAELLEQVHGVHVGPPKPRYSNLGFQLLGHAIAAAEGAPYRDLVAASFGPGLTAPHSPDELGPSALRGVSARGAARDPWVGEAVAPAGGLRASITTMAALLGGILDGTAPGLGALDPVADFAPGVRIGAGWITLSRGDHGITWHNGGTGGFRSFIGVDRQAGVGAVALSARSSSVDRAGFAMIAEHGGGPRRA